MKLIICRILLTSKSKIHIKNHSTILILPNIDHIINIFTLLLFCSPLLYSNLYNINNLIKTLIMLPLLIQLFTFRAVL